MASCPRTARWLARAWPRRCSSRSRWRPRPPATPCSCRPTRSRRCRSPRAWRRRSPWPASWRSPAAWAGRRPP
ncbi:MAG: hypothetical protein DMF80_18185 [Acidobacteria bacterium]|nr:MAG: hypothetical protein DMF80_18185 [Acidobacteriota bacterium]